MSYVSIGLQSPSLLFRGRNFGHSRQLFMWQLCAIPQDCLYMRSWGHSLLHPTGRTYTFLTVVYFLCFYSNEELQVSTKTAHNAHMHFLKTRKGGSVFNFANEQIKWTNKLIACRSLKSTENQMESENKMKTLEKEECTRGLSQDDTFITCWS